MLDPERRFSGLELADNVAEALQAVLPRMAERTVAAVTVEVPSYADGFSGRMGQNIENAVQMALGAFLRLATRAEGTAAGTQLSPALEGAYELGRGEARTGRSIDALLAAYRVGAGVAWRELSSTAVANGLPAAGIARFAELVFAFIDELSGSSVAGHADELATTGRVRERYLSGSVRTWLPASRSRLCKRARRGPTGSHRNLSPRCSSPQCSSVGWRRPSIRRPCN